jgi:IclR family KDG regulon transcriptional repressor
MKKSPEPSDYLSVQKALQILLAFVPHNKEMGTLEVSKRLGLHKSTVSRLLSVLCHYDFFQYDPKTRKFRLGRAAAKIGTAVRQSLREHLIGIAQPYIDDLRDTVGETVALEVWNGNSTILAYRAEALQSKRVYLLNAGDRVDVHVSAGARAILAFSPPHVVENVLGGEFKRFTPNTITDPNTLKEQMVKVRVDGYARSSGERHVDSEIIAFPIFNYEKKPVAAMSVFTTSERIASLVRSDALSLLKETAGKISAKLLYSEED